MHLEEFFDYKNRFMEDLIKTSSIVRLLSDDYKQIEDPEGLVYKQIFPYEYVPGTIDKGSTFICCDVDIQSTSNKTFLSPTLYVWVFSHKTKLHLPERGGVRTDKLCSEIAKVLNGSRYYGLGELELLSVRRFSPIIDYQGKVMTFQAKDFNRPSPTNKPIPGNRKHG